jgi:membrane-bound lytic murein transglycosylase A
MKAGSVPAFLVWALLLFLQACGPKAGLHVLPAGRPDTAYLQDDLDFADLGPAVGQSLKYYGRIDPETVFRYGELTYTAREMEASTRLFLGIIEGLEGEERIRAIGEKFHFFESRNKRGRAFFTGYYEPLLDGSREESEEFRAPLFAVPADLLTVDLGRWIDIGLLPEDLENRKLRGKVSGGAVVPYDDRDSIFYGGSLKGRAAALAWIRDHVELSFLQIQGSGVIRLEDGTLLRVNYADQNGHPYRAVGRVLLDRIPREEMSLQRIRGYLREHPEEVREILNYNPSYTFFRIVEEGPLGNIEVPLTPGRSVAMDHRLVPRGGLAFFQTSFPEESLSGIEKPLSFGRFGVVQDTGGAIRGHGRVDVFWGSGEAAERIAGPMKEEGRIFLLVARKEYLEETYSGPSEKIARQPVGTASGKKASRPGAGAQEAGLLFFLYALFAVFQGL